MLRSKSSDVTKTEMGRWLWETEQYIESCQQKNRRVDWDRVFTQYAHAFAAGILKNDCGDGFVFEMPERWYISDKHFKILMDALLEKSFSNKKGKPENITFKIPHSKISDNSLLILASVIRSPKCRESFTVDISGSSAVTAGGLQVLLGALVSEDCNMGFSIKLPKGRYPEALVKAIEDQVVANNKKYQSPKVATPDKGKTKIKKDKSKDKVAKPAKKKTASAAKRGVFSRSAAKKTDKAEKPAKKSYKKLSKK